MQYLRQSTSAIVLVGPVLDADGAAVTGAVIGDFRLSKNGIVSTMSGNTINHSHNGCYLITLTTANTDTLDRLSISMGNTAYGMTVFRYTVLTAAQYDALIANGTITPAAIEAALVNEGDATALLQAIADKIAGDLTAGDLTALAIVSAIKADATLAQMISRIDVATSTRLASGSYTAPPTAATVASAVWDKATVDHTSTGSFGAGVGYIITTVAAILVGVNQLTSRITSTLFSGITRLSHWLGAIAGKTADTATRTEINATTAGATYNETTDSQEAIRDRGDAAWSTAASGAVYVLPTKGTQQDRRASTDEIRIYRTEGYTLVRTVTDATGANVDLSGKTLELIIEGENRNDKAVVPDGSISVSGTGNATYTIEIPTTVSAKADKTYSFYLWDKTVSARPKLLDNGKFIITYAGTSGTT